MGTNITFPCSAQTSLFLIDRQLLVIKARFHGRSVLSRKSDVQD
jgi:hypothetical protein